MSEQDIYGVIKGLVDTEHELRTKTEAGELDPATEKTQLATIEVQLDQCWDLLRHRRARKDSGQSPDGAEVSSVEQVEGYLQ